uniref:Uncharacterized protein n=1 Tax=Acrobeloides nanus TaxID=290746 RepID=A0A914DA01_9BILA
MKKIPDRPTRLSCSIDLTPPNKPTTSFTPSRNSRPRYRSRRISILPLTPETPEDEEGSISPSSRQVRFGICEEIQYDELENDVIFEEELLPLPAVLSAKPKSCLRERSSYSEAETHQIMNKFKCLLFV